MDHKVVTEFREILRIFERELDRQNNSICCCGVTLSQCHVLMELAKTDPISLNQLAKQLAVDKSAASRTVEQLVTKKLVQRSIPKADRRTTMLALTPTGLQVCRQINEGNNAYYDEALQSVPAGDLAVFLRSFGTIVSHMRKMNLE
jgi:DNA-binding MarR family transcriptional regulator